MRHDMLQWKDLLERLQQMSPDELEGTVTVHTQVLDEFHGCTGFGVSSFGGAADGVLDHGHMYLEIDG